MQLWDSNVSHAKQNSVMCAKPLNQKPVQFVFREPPLTSSTILVLVQKDFMKVTEHVSDVLPSVQPAKFPLHVIHVPMSTEISAITVHVSLDIMMLELIFV